MIDYRKVAVVPMYPRVAGAKPFELLIYGRTAIELLTIPNKVVSELARRYPQHQSSPFILRDWSRP